MRCWWGWTLAQASLVAQTVHNPPANAGDQGSTPDLGRSPGEENGNPLQGSCLENPTGRGAGGLQCVGSQSRTRLSD